MRFTLAKRAVSDIEHIRQHIGRENPHGASNVIAAIEDAMGFVAAHPHASRLVLPQIRMKIVQPYGYKIFYEASDEGIEVLHVRHPSRSSNWR